MSDLALDSELDNDQSDAWDAVENSNYHQNLHLIDALDDDAIGYAPPAPRPVRILLSVRLAELVVDGLPDDGVDMKSVPVTFFEVR